MSAENVKNIAEMSKMKQRRWDIDNNMKKKLGCVRGIGEDGNMEETRK